MNVTVIMNQNKIIGMTIASLLLTMAIAPNAHALSDLGGSIDIEGLEERFKQWFEDSKKELQNIEPKAKPDKKIKQLEKKGVKLSKQMDKVCDKADKFKEKFEKTNKAKDLSKALNHGKKCATVMYKLDETAKNLETQQELKAKYFS